MTEISQRRHFFDNPDRYDTDTEEITGSLHRSRCVYKLGLWELTCVLLQDLCTCHVPMGNIQLQFMISGIVNIVNFPHNNRHYKRTTTLIEQSFQYSRLCAAFKMFSRSIPQ